MNAKFFRMNALVFAVAAFIGIFAAFQPALHAADDILKIHTAKGMDYVFHIEEALTSRQKEKGLMNRASLANDAGMLFPFDHVGRPQFWMKDTLIPLDLVFIDQNGMIVHIHHMARPLDESTITVDRPVKAVLEIKGGVADGLGIAEGDRVVHPVFRNDQVDGE